MTVWPSGLRRWLQAPVRKGVGSNPTAVTWLRAGARQALRLRSRGPAAAPIRWLVAGSLLAAVAQTFALARHQRHDGAVPSVEHLWSSGYDVSLTR